MSIDHDSRGLWLATKYDLSLFSGDPRVPTQTILSSGIYRKAFGTPFDALADMSIASNGDIWTGSWNGRVLRYRAGVWQRLAEKGSPFHGRIRKLLRDQDSILVANGNRIWRWNDPKRTFDSVAQFDKPVEALVRSSRAQLFAATSDSVWQEKNGSWQLLWQQRAKANSGITSLHAWSDVLLLVGTRNGYIRLRTTGAVEGHKLKRHWITAFEPGRDGRFWVGSWDHGLLLWDGSAWYQAGKDQGLPGNSIYTLSVDSQGRLWVSFYGQKNMVLAEDEAARWMQNAAVQY